MGLGGPEPRTARMRAGDEAPRSGGQAVAPPLDTRRTPLADAAGERGRDRLDEPTRRRPRRRNARRRTAGCSAGRAPGTHGLSMCGSCDNGYGPCGGTAFARDHGRAFHGLFVSEIGGLCPPSPVRWRHVSSRLVGCPRAGGAAGGRTRGGQGLRLGGGPGVRRPTVTRHLVAGSRPYRSAPPTDRLSSSGASRPGCR